VVERELKGDSWEDQLVRKLLFVELLVVLVNESVLVTLEVGLDDP
jgi:hypothetical protein